MTWDYRIIRRRVCSGCGGTCGWNCQDKFQKCRACKGKGIEEEEVSLEDALKDSKIIDGIWDALGDMMGNW